MFMNRPNPRLSMEPITVHYYKFLILSFTVQSYVLDHRFLLMIKFYLHDETFSLS